MSDRQYDKEKEILQKVLEQSSRAEGLKTGFVRRQSKVTAELFVQMMVLACLERADVTLRDIVTVGADLGVEVTEAGVHQRMNESALQLLQAVLQSALSHCQPEGTSDCAVLEAFPAVYIEDCSYISLPAALVVYFPGSGGAASAASAKVRLVYEYRMGKVEMLDLLPGRHPDQSCEVPEIPGSVPGSLYLFDLGFFGQERLRELDARQDYFLCRYQNQTALYTPAGARYYLDAKLATTSSDKLEFEFLLGAKARLPIRLIAQRLPKDVVKERRKKAMAAARRMRRTLTQRTLELLEWNIFCTNVPATLWSFDQVLAVYPLRWQVELLFKLWKSDAGLDCVGKWRPARVLSQLYARLIALVLAHFLMGPVRFPTSPPDSRELSLPKAFARLQRMVPLLASAIAAGWHHLPSLLRNLHRLWLRLDLKTKRRKKPSTYDQLRLAGA